MSTTERWRTTIAPLRIDPKLALARRNRMLAAAAKARDDSVHDYDATIRVNPDTAVAFYNRGNAHMANREFDLAIADFDRAIRLDPRDAAALVNRGNAFRKKGARSSSIRAIPRHSTIAPMPI